MDNKDNKKTKILLLSVIIVGLIIGIFCIVNETNYKKITNIQEFNYNYSGGWAVNDNVNYEITCVKKCTANIRLERQEYNDIPLSDSTMSELVKLLNKYKISKWNGFDKRVDWTDQASFNLKIKINRSNTISASGYGRFPNNHFEFKDELNKLMRKCMTKDYLVRDLDEEYKGHLGVDRRYSIGIDSNNNTNYKQFMIDSEKELDALNNIFNNEIDITDVDFKTYILFLKYIPGNNEKYDLKGVFIRDNKLVIEENNYIPDSYYDIKSNYLIGALVYRGDIKGVDTSDWIRPSTVK